MVRTLIVFFLFFHLNAACSRGSGPFRLRVGVGVRAGVTGWVFESTPPCYYSTRKCFLARTTVKQ